jgi:transcriptional regulator with XRE-family HTH domain
MAGDDDLDRYRYRRGYWLRMARRRAGRLTLETVAKLMEYSERSSSTIKLWEDGKRDPSDVQLRRIAALYNVPVEVFTDPDETDEERLDEKVRRLVAERARRSLDRTG